MGAWIQALLVNAPVLAVLSRPVERIKGRYFNAQPVPEPTMRWIAAGSTAGKERSANMRFSDAAKSPSVSTMVPSRSTMAASKRLWWKLMEFKTDRSSCDKGGTAGKT